MLKVAVYESWGTGALAEFWENPDNFPGGDIEVVGLAGKHKCESTPDHDSDDTSTDSRVETCPPNNVIEFDNAIQIIETGGLRIAIWGDNRAVPDPFLDHYLKNVDVLILPIETILTRNEVDAILRKYDPKAIIPAHYFLNGLTTDVSGLESAARSGRRAKDSKSSVRARDTSVPGMV